MEDRSEEEGKRRRIDWEGKRRRIDWEGRRTEDGRGDRWERGL